MTDSVYLRRGGRTFGKKSGRFFLVCVEESMWRVYNAEHWHKFVEGRTKGASRQRSTNTGHVPFRELPVFCAQAK